MGVLSLLPTHTAVVTSGYNPLSSCRDILRRPGFSRDGHPREIERRARPKDWCTSLIVNQDVGNYRQFRVLILRQLGLAIPREYGLCYLQLLRSGGLVKHAAGAKDAIGASEFNRFDFGSSEDE